MRTQSIDPPYVDDEIRAVDEWLSRACEALLSFFNPGAGVFWRDNQEKQNNDPGKSPTSTLRAFVALNAYLNAASEDDLAPSELASRALAATRAVAEQFLTEKPSREEVRKSGTNEFNVFTDAQILIAVSLLPSLQRRFASSSPSLQMNPANAIADADSIATEIGGVLKDHAGATLAYQASGDDLPHDFITLYAVRGLDAIKSFSKNADLNTIIQQRLRKDVLSQLGFHAAGISSRFDPSELAFVITLLNRMPTPDTPRLTDAAVKVIIDAQTTSGAWPQARLVSYSDKRILHIASFEVALALSYLVRIQPAQDKAGWCEVLLKTFGATFRLIKSSYREVQGAAGWPNDHARSEKLVESWTTAMVLAFLSQYRDLLLSVRQESILAKYHARHPKVIPTVPWPDMTAMLREPEWINSDCLSYISDPSKDGTLVKALQAHFLDPIRKSWIAKPEAASLILYGPPGTRKTTLVNSIAEALGWPCVTISPPHFLRHHGLEGFETAAAEIFEDLFRLRRVVVFFDECEDFFKKRQDEQKLESRTIGAFITAGMLPSRLRKKGILIPETVRFGAWSSVESTTCRC
jgi:hypothetical protein